VFAEDGDVTVFNFAPESMKTALPLEDIKRVIKAKFGTGQLKMINFENWDVEIPDESTRIDDFFPDIPGERKTSKTVSVSSGGNLKTEVEGPVENPEIAQNLEWFNIDAKKFHNEPIGEADPDFTVPNRKFLTWDVIRDMFPGCRHEALYDSMLSHFGNVRFDLLYYRFIMMYPS